MGTEVLAITFTILFTIATSGLLGRYLYRVFTGKRRHVQGTGYPPLMNFRLHMA